MSDISYIYTITLFRDLKVEKKENNKITIISFEEKKPIAFFLSKTEAVQCVENNLDQLSFYKGVEGYYQIALIEKYNSGIQQTSQNLIWYHWDTRDNIYKEMEDITHGMTSWVFEKK